VIDTAKAGALRLPQASAVVRIECADAFAADYVEGKVAPSQRRGAELVLELFIKDCAEEVRAAIARQLVACPFLPSALARMIADDIDTIALPMIRGSTVLDDHDLIEIVGNGSETRQVAVASRRLVSRPVSTALVATRNRRVVSALLANDGADIGEEDLACVVDGFVGDQSINGLLIGRAALPLTVIDRLLAAAGMEFRHVLEDAMKLPGPIVSRICTLAHEQLMVGYVRACTSIRDVEDLAARLDGRQGLTSTLVLRALCTADVQFFGICVARKSRRDAASVRRMIQQGQVDGLRKLYRETDWPEAAYRAFTTILRLYLEERRDSQALTPDTFAAKATDRLVRDFPELSPGGLDVALAQICWHLR
jgi:uncharacterized protein (DUF2336 family)